MLGMSCKTWYISNANKLGRGRVLGVFYIHLFKQKILLNMCLIFKALDNNFALSSAIPFHLDLAVRNTTFSLIHQFLNFETIFLSFFTILSSFCHQKMTKKKPVSMMEKHKLKQPLLLTAKRSMSQTWHTSQSFLSTPCNM